MENEEFGALQEFVNETKERLSYKDLTKKEQKAYALILQISTRLEEVHHQHADLLHACTDLKTSALQAAQEALYLWALIPSISIRISLHASLVLL